MKALLASTRQLVVTALPTLVLVLATVLVGAVTAWLLRRLTRWAVRASGLETLAEGAGISKLLYAVGARTGLAELCGRLARSLVWLLTFVALADLLHLDVVSELLAVAVQLLPRLVAAGAILLGGVAVASFVRRLIRAMDPSHAADDDGGLDRPHLVADLIYYMLVVVAATLAADQTGLHTELVQNLILLGAGLSLASVALAFGWGSTSVFRHLATRHYYDKLVRAGDRVRIDDVEGVVVRFSPVALVLRTGNDGEVIIPCAKLAETAVHVMPLGVIDPTEASHPDSTTEGREQT